MGSTLGQRRPRGHAAPSCGRPLDLGLGQRTERLELRGVPRELRAPITPSHPDHSPEDPGDLWASAARFSDLLALTSRFLKGEPIGFPGWATSETDEESDDMQPTLLAANEAGLLSVASQPGAPFGPGHDDLTWGGRAFVGGFAEPASAAAIQERAKHAGLWAKDGAKDGPFVIPTGLRGGTPYLLLGSDAKDHELELFRDRVGSGAFAALESATFLWIIDPAWGRRERLCTAF